LKVSHVLLQYRQHGSLDSVAIILSKLTRTPLRSEVRNHLVGKLGTTTSRSDAFEFFLLLQRAQPNKT